MKRIVLFLVLTAMLLSTFSCTQDQNKDLPDSTEKAFVTGNTGDPDFDNAVPDSEFEYPNNPQKSVVNYIREMALTEWTPKETFQLYGKYQAWGYNLTYEEGTKYYGPPFLVDSRGTMQEFKNSIEDGVYVGGTKYNNCIGSACYDAVYVTLIQFCPSISFKSTEDMLPGNNTGLLPVGDWDPEISKHDTKTIMSEYTKTEMAANYAKLKPGDVVLKHLVSQDAGHTRIVSGGPVVYYNSDGSLNFNKSYITTIEQTNAWDKKVTHNTTWFVDHVYTFSELYDTNFLPLTPVDYTKDVSRASITAKDIIGADKIANARKLTGELTSNHYITEVKITITKGEDKVIYETSYFPNAKKVYLEDIKFRPELYDKVSGTYHFKLEASLAFGTKTMAEYDFELE